MFFPERIKSIKDNDKVLEIGPGATPFHRSDVFLELNYDSDTDRIAQSGHTGILKTDKQIIYYNGKEFPFKDDEFDYVICSHVLEHVDDIPLFINEIQRISKKGYLEFPNIYYDYLHNIEEHLNMLMVKDNQILWCKKIKTPITNLNNFTDFFRTLQRNNYRFQDEINNLWHQGFEWENNINIKQVENWQDLTYSMAELELIINPVKRYSAPNKVLGIKASIKSLLKAIKRKFKK